jgi:hypothetical protein
MKYKKKIVYSIKMEKIIIKTKNIFCFFCCFNKIIEIKKQNKNKRYNITDKNKTKQNKTKQNKTKKYKSNYCNILYQLASKINLNCILFIIYLK